MKGVCSVTSTCTFLPFHWPKFLVVSSVKVTIVSPSVFLAIDFIPSPFISSLENVTLLSSAVPFCAANIKYSSSVAPFSTFTLPVLYSFANFLA